MDGWMQGSKVFFPVKIAFRSQENDSFTRKKPWSGPGSGRGRGITDGMTYTYRHPNFKICLWKHWTHTKALLPLCWGDSRPTSEAAGLSVYVRVGDPLRSEVSKLLSKSRMEERLRETPASAVYTDSKWKQYSFVILSGRCWSSVGLEGEGLGSLRSLYYDWLCRLAPLIQPRAWQRESGGGAFSRHLWVNLSKGHLKRKHGADNPPLGHRWS